MDASPGTPYNVRYGTIGEWVQKEPLVVFHLIRDRLRKLLSASEKDLERAEADPLWAVQQGFCDGVYPFHKREPHSLQKVQERRFRIICGISMVDQGVERFLFGDFSKCVKRMYPRGPATIGLSVSDPGIEALGEVVRTRKGHLHSSDVSGFDSVQYLALMMAVLGLCFALCINRAKCVRWRLACRFRITLLTACVYVLSDGSMLVKKNNSRVLPSGSYLTSLIQSLSRVFLAYYIGSTWVKAQGDDCLEENSLTSEELEAAYQSIGIPVRNVESCTATDFEFCSHRYKYENGSWIAYLTSWPKTVFSILTDRVPTLEKVTALEYETRHNPERSQPRFKAMLRYLEESCINLSPG